MSTIEQTATGAPAGTFAADTVHSKIGFEVPYAVATFSGEVPGFAATLVDGALEGSADIATIQLKDENLKGHLLSPEFFDAEQHPQVGFKSTGFTRSGDTVELPGELTLKGITKPATLKGTIVGPTVDHFGATRVGLKLSTVIDRREFDMSWQMPLPNGEPALSWNVTLTAELTLVQA